MATLSVQNISRSALTPGYQACSGGGDEFPNDGKTMIHIKNGHTSPQTITIATQLSIDGKAIADDAIAVTNAQERMIGPFPPHLYNDVNGKVQLTYSGVISLTIGIMRMA